MITIIGPRDTKVPGTINTTSHSNADWSRGLSPFTLGPITLYGAHTARVFENAWQFAKLYPEHADANGLPTHQYWTWAQNGWKSTTAFRYPLGKGRKPLCSLWNGRRLDYIAARQQIYIPLYQNAVKQTNAYRTLEHLYLAQGHLTLFDFERLRPPQARNELERCYQLPNPNMWTRIRAGYHVDSWIRFLHRRLTNGRPSRRSGTHERATSLLPNKDRQPQDLQGT